MFPRLLSATHEGNDYVRMWEYFAAVRLSANELLKLVNEVISSAHSVHGSAATMQQLALLALWSKLQSYPTAQ